MKTAFLSVIYPGVEAYLKEFWDSLEAQTDKDFFVYILCDGIKNPEQFFSSKTLSVRIQSGNGTPGALRKQLVQWAVAESSELLVFGDSDDYFAANRVERIKTLSTKHGVIANELVLFGKNIPAPFPMLGDRFSEGEAIREENLRQYNCLGLSNTAVRSELAGPVMAQIPEDLIAFDWAFFATLLSHGHEAVFTKSTQTWYRQHSHNIASPISSAEADVARGLTVKAAHYEFLNKKAGGWYGSQAKYFLQIKNQFENNPAFRETYLKTIANDSNPHPLWWEKIREAVQNHD